MKQPKTRTELIEILATKYPKMMLKTSEEFDGGIGGIWTSGEDSPINSKGLPIFDHYGDFKKYDLGIEIKFLNSLKKLGWFGEWYDCGTMFLWKI